MDNTDLVECLPIDILPEKYRRIFSDRFTSFNKVQSYLFKYIFNSHKSLGKYIFAKFFDTIQMPNG